MVPLQEEILTQESAKAIAKFLVPTHMEAQFQKDKEADFSYYAPEIGRFRVNVFYQRGELSFALRHVKTNIPTIESVSLPPTLKTLAEANDGIILVCGSTGSGKSTTLAAMLDYVNTSKRAHIITLEDPIEFVFEDKLSVINQREIGLDTTSFKRALTYVLRQDPDIIMIGEMRESESVTAAVSAAETGHLVMSTLHSSTASQSISRLLDFFKADERDYTRSQLATTLRAVICQKLVPAASGEGVYPAVEILVNSPSVRKLLEQNKLEKLPMAIESGKDEGMQSFNQSLLGLFERGLITDEAALEQSPNPDALKMNLKGIFLNESGGILG